MCDTRLAPGFTPDYSYAGNLSLSNVGDIVRLRCNGLLIDDVQFDTGPFPNTSGKAFNLDPGRFSETANDVGDNWCDAASVFGSGDFGTPAAVNDFCSLPPVCGDGIVDPPEECDDGNTDDCTMSVPACRWRAFPPFCWATTGTFSKIYPGLAEINVPSGATFTWGQSYGAVDYEICVSNNIADCNSIGPTGTWSSVGKNTSTIVAPLGPSTIYYWNVRSESTTGTYTYAGRDSFISASAP